MLLRSAARAFGPKEAIALVSRDPGWPATALALGASQRTVQRALDSLAAAGKAQSLVAGERAVG